MAILVSPDVVDFLLAMNRAEARWFLDSMNDIFEREDSAIMATTGDPHDVETPEPLLKFFACAHLPDGLRQVSQPFGDLAEWIVKTLPRNPERTVALRKLLEAKDCAVRSRL